MSDLSKWKVHGPVRTLRSEFAEWDLSKEEWGPPRNSNVSSFRSDGRLNETEAHNTDGSVSRSAYTYDTADRLYQVLFSSTTGQSGRTTYYYDELGRFSRVSHLHADGTEHVFETWSYDPDVGKTKTYSVPPLPPDTNFGYTIEGTELSYSAPGAATIVTLYDQASSPVEVRFQDAEQRLLQRIVLERDDAGRLVKEEVHRVSGLPPEVPFDLFQPVTTYSYDSDGRVQERVMRMGVVGEERSTFRYDDWGNVVELFSKDIRREMELHEEGRVEQVKESSYRQETKMDYVYDVHGNWTEKVVSIRPEPNPNFQPSNVERREITYYGA